MASICFSDNIQVLILKCFCHPRVFLLSKWLAFGGQDTPLTVVNAAVKSIVMVSDIFTQANQFKWMLSTLR